MEIACIMEIDLSMRINDLLAGHSETRGLNKEKGKKGGERETRKIAAALLAVAPVLPRFWHPRRPRRNEYRE